MAAIARGQITISEQYDGYTIILSKETIVIPCTSLGTPFAGELGTNGRAVVTVKVLKGGVPLTVAAPGASVQEGQFKCPVNVVSGCGVTRVNDSTIAISSVSSDSGKFVFDIYLESTSNMMQREVSFSKSKQGETGEMLAGKMLYNDPEFKKGVNGIVKYNNTSGSGVVVSSVARESNTPTTSPYCLKITSNGVCSPGFGGFLQPVQSRANAVFIHKFIAKVPIGYTILETSGSMGTGYTRTWLTPQSGTGKYEVYMVKVTCGDSGSFKLCGYVYLSDGTPPTEASPLEWYVAYSTIFDLTADEYDELSSIAKSVEGYKNKIDETYKTETALYAEIYNNTLLTGTPKSDLLAKKTVLETSHTVLQDTIASVTSDGITTVAEETTVDAKYSLFNDSVANFNRALEVAKQAISDKQAQDVVDNVQTGTRNLITNRHNVITSSSDYPDLSSYSSVINAKGEREVTVTCIKINASWSHANRYAWYTDKLSEPIIPFFYVLSFDYKCSNRCRVSTCVRNNDGTSIINYFKDFDSSNGKWERGFFLINWTTVTTQYRTLFAISADCTVLNSTVSYRNLKLVRGNKGWDDSEAPEDIDKQIKDSEAKAIQEAQAKANAAKDAAILAANTASQAKIDLLKTQELANLDGKITAEEKRAIADAQTKYNNAVSEAQKKADAAKKAAIDAAALDASNKIDNIQIGGTNLARYSGGAYLDVLGLYVADRARAVKATIDGRACLQMNNTAANTTIRVGRVDIPEAGTYTLSFWIKGTTAYSCSLVNYNGTGYNGVSINVKTGWSKVVVTFEAKTAYDIVHISAKAETTYITDWKYEKGNKATDWSPSLEDIHAEIDDVSKALGTLDTTINSTFKDGIINKAETDLIKSNINTLNAEKKGIDAGYTTLYNNVYLLSGSTAATNLSSAKTAYNTAHANLISSINTAIADSKATVAEKADVDAKFTAYGAALANYEDKVEAANKAIQDRVKDITASDITKDRKFFVGNFDNGGTFGQFLWKTTIPEKTNIMWKVDISGYLYGAQTSFGVQLVFYPYSSGLARFGYMITGSDHVDRIRLGVIDGKIAIELKLIGDIYYPNFDITISATHGGNTALLKSYSQGWVELTGTIAGGDLLPITATNVVTVPQGLSYDAAKAQEAAVAAETADKKAQNAASEAGKANSKLSDWATDAKVNPSEKLQLKQQQANIQAEYTEISAQSTRYNLKSDATWTAYNTAYSNANAALTTYTAATPEFITIVSATWNNIAAYYPKRQAVLDKIAVAAKAYANTVANDAVDNLQIGSRNLFLNSGKLIKNGSYNIAVYTTTEDLVAGKRYTIALRGTTIGGQRLGAYMNAGNSIVANFKVNMTDEIAYIPFTAIAPNAANIRKIHFYNLSSSGCAANPATIKWAALYEGVVKPPSDWMPAPEDVENDIDTAIEDTKTWVDTAKNKIASQLGFTDYTAFSVSAALGKTLISGGKINTELIEANIIVANGIAAVKLNASNITTGTLSADRIAANSITSAKLDAASIKANIINVGYINGLTCTFDKGTIGGWSITPVRIAQNAVGLLYPGKAGYIGMSTTNHGSGNFYAGAQVLKGFSIASNTPGTAYHLVMGQMAASGTTIRENHFGLQMMSHTGIEYFALGFNASNGVIYNKIAGWTFDNTKLYSGNLQLVSGGAISNTTGKWALNNDGSGKLANGNISWDAAGTVTFGANVSLQWKNDIEKSKSNNYGYRYSKTITLNGEHNKYYPVVIKSGDQNVKRKILIKRSYSELHPPEWNSATHGGGLTLLLKTNFGGWGGANYSWEVHELEEMYNSTFAGAQNCLSSMGYAIFLRGGGTTGAVYHIYSDQPIDTALYGKEGCQICYNSDSLGQTGSYSWTAPAPRTRSSADIEEIQQRLIIVNSKNSYATLRDHPLTKIDANGIYTGTLTAAQVNAVAINAGSITTGTLSADRIGAGSITADKIKANSITATQIATGTITATQIKSRTILADRIVVGAITANEIATNAITAVKIMALAITADKIAANTITATQLNVANVQAAVVTATHINGLTCTFGKGSIGGFTIGTTELYSGHSYSVANRTGMCMKNTSSDRRFAVYSGAGNEISMYQNAAQYGLLCLSGGNTIFQLGSVNKIGGWNFDGGSFYSGTSKPTIGSDGLTTSGMVLGANGSIAAPAFCLKSDGSGKIGPFTISKSDLTAASVIPESTYYNQTLMLKNDGMHFKKGMGSIYQREAYIGTNIDMPNYGKNTMLLIQGGDIFHQGGNAAPNGAWFYTSNVLFRGECKQHWGGDENPVKLPLICGAQHIGDVSNDVTITVGFGRHLTRTSYMVFCTFLVNSGQGKHNNDLTYVITDRGTNYFNVCIGNRAGDTNDVWLQYLVVGED